MCPGLPIFSSWNSPVGMTKLTIPNIHCVMYVHIFVCNPTSNDVDKIGEMTSWIQGIDASQKFIPVIGVRSDVWWLLFFVTRDFLLSCYLSSYMSSISWTIILQVCMPIVLGFLASGLYLWFHLEDARNARRLSLSTYPTRSRSRDQACDVLCVLILWSSVALLVGDAALSSGSTTRSWSEPMPKKYGIICSIAQRWPVGLSFRPYKDMF